MRNVPLGHWGLVSPYTEYRNKHPLTTSEGVPVPSSLNPLALNLGRTNVEIITGKNIMFTQIYVVMWGLQIYALPDSK